MKTQKEMWGNTCGGALFQDSDRVFLVMSKKFRSNIEQEMKKSVSDYLIRRTAYQKVMDED